MVDGLEKSCRISRDRALPGCVASLGQALLISPVCCQKLHGLQQNMQKPTRRAPKPQTPNNKTLNLKLLNLNPKPLDPKPEALNPKTLNLNP